MSDWTIADYQERLTALGKSPMFHQRDYMMLMCQLLIDLLERQ